MRQFRYVLAHAVLYLVSVTSAAAQAGGTSPLHPFVLPFPESDVVYHEVQDVASYRLALGPLVRDPDAPPRFTKVEMLDGRVTRVQISYAGSAPALDVFQHYRDTLRSSGFLPLLEGHPVHANDVGGYNWTAKAYASLHSTAYDRLDTMSDDRHYLAAHRTSPEGIIYVTLLTLQRAAGEICTQIDVIEVPRTE